MEHPLEFIIEEWRNLCTCVICNVKLAGDFQVEFHAHHINHIEGAKKYGGQISRKEGTKYYCELCKCNLVSWKCIFTHIRGKMHESLIKKTRQFIVEMSLGGYYCVICDFEFITIDAVTYHLRSEAHRLMIENYGCDLVRECNGFYNCTLCKYDNLSFGIVPGHAREKIHQENLERFKKSCKFIVKKPKGQYYCGICDHGGMASRSQVLAHTSAARHRIAEETYDPDGNILYCKYCRCAINPHDDDLDHPNGNIRQGYREKSDDKSNDSKDLSCPFVVRNDDAGYNCTICRHVTLHYECVENHIRGKDHKTALNKYSSYITIKGKNDFYCNHCERSISCNVYCHVEGKDHLNTIYGMIKREIEVIEIPSNRAKRINTGVKEVQLTSSILETFNGKEFRETMKMIVEGVLLEMTRKAQLKQEADKSQTDERK